LGTVLVFHKQIEIHRKGTNDLAGLLPNRLTDGRIQGTAPNQQEIQIGGFLGVTTTTGTKHHQGTRLGLL